MFTQPVVAGCFIPVAQSSGSYTDSAFGCKGYKTGAGSFVVTFDDELAVGSYIPVATPIFATIEDAITPIVTALSASEILVDCVDQDGDSVDCGLGVVIVPIPTRG